MIPRTAATQAEKPPATTAPRPKDGDRGPKEGDRAPKEDNRGRVSAAAQQAAVARLIRTGLPVFCGGGKGRYVALTFDDGPGPYTPLALRILRQAHARATFFLVGRNIDPWRSLVRQETRLAALGDHSWTHPDLTRLPPSESLREIANTKRAIARASHAPVLLFRPPYGARNKAVDGEAGRLGLLEIVWDLPSGDSEGADWLGIAHNVSSGLHPGAIVAMHENRGQTIEALKFRILPELRQRGYTTVTVPELLALDPPSIGQLKAGFGGCTPHTS
jgi:peptidoglycan/xylan/chitin deacetylase (PgdA/CDA1 family)